MKKLLVILLLLVSISAFSVDLDSIKLSFISKRNVLYSLENKRGYSFPIPPVNISHIFTLSGDSLVATINNTITHKSSLDNIGASLFLTDISGVTDSRSIYNTTTGTYQLSYECEYVTNKLTLNASRVYYTYREGDGSHVRLDRIHNICTKFGIPEEKFVVCLDYWQPQSANGDVALEPTFYGDAIRYCKSMGYNFKMWEAGNEPFYSWGVYNDEIVYSNYVKAVYDTIKSVDITCLVGISPQRYTYSSMQVLTLAKNHYDWVSPHWYGWADLDVVTPSAAILAENFRTIDYASKVNDSVATINGTNSIFQFDTEYRLYPFTSTTTGETDIHIGNIVGALHMAVRMLYNIRDGYERGSTSWLLNDANPQSLVPAGYYPDSLGSYVLGDGKTTPIYWAKYYFSRYTFENVLSFSGKSPSYIGTVERHVDEGTGPLTVDYTGPRTPMIVTTNSDKSKIGIIAINGTSTATPFDIDLGSFATSKVTAKYLSQPLNNFWVIESELQVMYPLTVTVASNHLKGMLNPYSATFIKAEKYIAPVSETYYINFGSFDVSPASSPWNTMRVYEKKANLFGLKNSAGIQTEVGIEATTGFDGYNNLGTAGSIYPDAVGMTAFFISDDVVRTMKVYNLDPTRVYNFTFFASRALAGTRITQYHIGATTVELDAVNNISNTVTISGVSPNSSGIITITVNRKAGSTFGYLNSLIINTTP